MSLVTVFKDSMVITQCENNGTCVDGIGDLVTCQCPETYTGERCESAFCSDNYCNNRGTCQIDFILNVTQCNCIPGYIRERCDVDIDVCDTNIPVMVEVHVMRDQVLIIHVIVMLIYVKIVVLILTKVVLSIVNVS